jgi:hypothetical protein
MKPSEMPGHYEERSDEAIGYNGNGNCLIGGFG